ncbi:YwqG family protein [Ureibacillus aquaedulcis]|uniref:YwqG family protein n=1 Tax=Ureibacillus aquaedulcis TaxID=3058421 RepID=A0ABT8GW69_9BACL|nr:YwqG family protein [Ureibacillus sp. BA0131]MDN4495464.1 YwqG family protein [Ureibacillus sp. BA0131]
MQTDKSIYLPRHLEGFRNKIESSVVSSLWITPSAGNPSLTDSKFAGYPYLPKSHLYPKDSNSESMALLAQINFEQLPSNPLFPNKGLLQFFISNKFNQPIEKKVELLFQHDFKVRYFPKRLNDNKHTHSFSYSEQSGCFPIQKERKLEFTPKHEPVSASDYRMEELLQISNHESEFISEDERTFEDIYFENFLAAEHKLGGYPYFIEYDTRKNSNFLKRFDTLLLQIVSNDEQGIMYGDSGVLKFFINQHALRNLDFSSVYFIAEQF